MIRGTGIDIEEIERIESLLASWGDRFADKIFTEGERRYCDAKPRPAQHYAARFAAKEAFSKALGTGWGNGFKWKDVEISTDAAGKPCIIPHNLLESKVQNCRISLSISHSSAFVAAVVIIEEPIDS